MNTKRLQKAARKARLAKALKANVKRRKAGAAAAAKAPQNASPDPAKSTPKD